MVIGGRLDIEDNLEVAVQGVDEIFGVQETNVGKFVQPPVGPLLKLVFEGAADCFCSVNLVYQNDLILVDVGLPVTFRHLQVNCQKSILVG